MKKAKQKQFKSQTGKIETWAGYSKDLTLFLFSIGLCLLAGFIGSAFTTPYISTWYASLAKPFFAPPNWLFGPAWTTLYILMGIALFLILRKWKEDAIHNKAICLFGMQLVLNVFWSFLFFTLKSPLIVLE